MFIYVAVVFEHAFDILRFEHPMLYPEVVEGGPIDFLVHGKLVEEFPGQIVLSQIVESTFQTALPVVEIIVVLVFVALPQNLWVNNWIKEF
jgi:hypothetical protein